MFLSRQKYLFSTMSAGALLDKALSLVYDFSILTRQFLNVSHRKGRKTKVTGKKGFRVQPCVRCDKQLGEKDMRILSVYDHAPIYMDCKKKEEQ